LQRLKEACEKAKCDLSGVTQAQINLPFITATSEGPKHLDITITRAKFESLVEDLMQRTVGPVKKALEDAKMAPSDIDEVILVGGATRMPRVQEIVREYFGKEPHKGVNPDEVVAVGAAIQGGILSGDVDREMVLLDVTPLSLGIETLGGVMTVLIPANTTIPTRKSEIFSTASDSQPTVDIHVLQGERPMAIYNKTIGRFQLDGIPPALRGIPQIEVGFDIDSNGILSVNAKDKATGKEQSIKIQHSSGLSKEEIERMKGDARSHESEDKKAREAADSRNQADAQVFQAERQLKELGEKMDAETKNKIQAAIDRLKEALKGSDISAIKNASDELTQRWNEASTKMYESTQQAQQAQYQQTESASGGQAAPPPPPSGNGAKKKKDEAEVESADYEVLDDDNK